MQRAVLALTPLPDMVLVDAFRMPDLPMAQRGVVHGDTRCTAIAAASIVAKVTRDRRCSSCTGAIRATGSTVTRATRRAIISTPWPRFGYSEVHRRSFRPPSLFDRIDSQA